VRQNLGTATSRAHDTADKTYADAIVAAGVVAAVASGTHAATSKATPVDADELFLVDSAASFGAKRLTVANLKALMAAYIVGAAPGALDTLKELADAIGDDANYAATITAALALKAPLSGAALVNPTITNYTETRFAIGNSGTAKTLDLANGTVQTVTMTGNCTFTMPAQPGAGQSKSFVLLANTGAGSFTGAFTGVKWSASTAPVLTATAARLDMLTFIADGTNWYGSVEQNFTP
jgi:hypothetical protein